VAGESAICAPKILVVVVVMACPPLSTSSAGEAKHGRALPAAPDERDDLRARHPQRIG
jgi:hypothetical protein